MNSMLPYLSFVFAGLLFVLIPLQLRIPALAATNVPVLSVIVWLLACNILQGVNALESSPSWCDLSTQALLALPVAISAACVCLCRHLELISSVRDVPFDEAYKRRQTLYEVFACVVLPSLYSLLHFVIQTHRFQLVQDFGCQTTLHNSLLSLFMVYLPPLACCSIGFVYLGLAITNMIRQQSAFAFTHHLESRSRLIPASFLRQLGAGGSMLVFIAVVVVHSVYAHIASGLVPWKSLADIRVDSKVIRVVGMVGAEEWGRISVTWWTVPILSIAAFLSAMMAAVFENNAVLAWWNAKTRRTPILPTTSRKSQVATLELKSGWDDSLRSRRSFGIRKTTKALSPKQRPISPIYRSETPPMIDVFAASTLSYLESPLAQTLGLSRSSSHQADLPLLSPTISPISPPPPMYFSPSIKKQQQRELKPQSFPAEDTTSTTSTIFGSQWPEPPRNIPVSPVLARGPSARRSKRVRDPLRLEGEAHEMGSVYTFEHPPLPGSGTLSPTSPLLEHHRASRSSADMTVYMSLFRQTKHVR